MKNSYLLLAASVFVALMALAPAATPNAALQSYLSVYLPNSTISQYSYSNVTVGSSNYVVMQSEINASQYLVVNSTGGNYSLVTNASSINAAITELVSTSFNSSNSQFRYLTTGMDQYLDEIGHNLTDCITETGFTIGTSTLTQAAENCQTVPICTKVLNAQDGADSPFGLGLVNFSVDNTKLNESVSSYFSLVSGTTAANFGSNLAALAGPISNISSVQATMDINPVFPPPETASFSNCNGALLPTQQPWYCVATGYCTYIPFDTNLLANLSSTQQQLSAQFPDQDMISFDSAASAAAAQSAITAKNQEENGAVYFEFLNSTYPLYNSTVAKLSAFLSVTANASLTNSLSSLKQAFGGVLANSINANIIQENASIHALIEKTLAQYVLANKTYLDTYTLAKNDTLDAVAAQLNYKNVPPSLALLASHLQETDANFSSKVNATEAILLLTELQAEKLQLMAYGPPLTLGYLVKAFDGWFIGAIEAGSSQPVAMKIASAPTYAAIEALVIGIVLLFIFYMLTYRNLAKRHKLKKSKGKRTAWIVLFAVLFALVLVYAYMSYSAAVSANSFLPFEYFTGTLKGSKSAMIALNGSLAYSNQSIVDCADSIAAALKSQGKSVTIVQTTNYTCVSNGAVSANGIGCYDKAVGSGVPVILMSAQGSGITYRGLYGEVLYANGQDASGSSCLASQLIERKG